MMKKLFILTAIITGFSFMSVDGNCTSGIYDTQYKQQQYSNNTQFNTENEVSDYGKYLIDKNLSEIEKLSEEIKKLTEEYGIDMGDSIQKKVMNIKEQYNNDKEKCEQLNQIKTNLQEINKEYDNNIYKLNIQYKNLPLDKDIKIFSEYLGKEQEIIQKRDHQLIERGFYDVLIFSDSI